MKYWRVLAIAALVLSGAAYGQGPANPRLDSLENVVRNKADTTQAYANAMRALVMLHRNNEPALARQLAQQYTALNQRLKRPAKYADGLSVQADLAYRAGEYQQAMALNLEAARLFDQVGDHRGICVANNTMGNINNALRNYPQARAYYERGLLEARRVLETVPPSDPDYALFSRKVAFGLNNIGTTYFRQNNYAEATKFFNQCIEQSKKLAFADGLAMAYTNLGDIANNQDNFPAALALFEQALQQDQVSQNQSGQAHSWLAVARAREGLGLLPAARAAALQSEALARKLEMASTRQQAVEALADIEEKMGNLRGALSYRRNSQVLRDTIFNQDMREQVAESQTKYETEKKESQNRLQAAQLRTQQQVIRRRNVQLWGGLAIAGLLAGLSYLLYTRRRLHREVEFAQERQQLARLRAQAVLEAEEVERRRIGSDLHDGVGQLLTAAKLNLHALGEQLGVQTEGQQALLYNALAVVDESFVEVRSISHNLMPNALIKRGLAQAVRDFLDKLPSTERLKINLEVVGLDRGGRLDATTENVLFRVIQELVQNILKHAKATEVTLQIVRHPDELTVLVEDNGVGFAPAALGPDAGIGLKNIESRMAFLGGRADFDAAPGRGTTVTLEVPLAANAA